jgi:hypothetical protein
MKAKKIILRSAFAFVALILIAIIALYLSLDGIVRAGVERGASHSTGQPTSLSSAKVSIAGGTLELTGLDVDNPPGYSKSKIISMKDCKSSAQISSLFTNDVIIPEIDIDGLEVTLEQNGLKSNLSDVLNVSKSSTPAAGGSSAPTPPGRNIHVGIIKITNSKVHLNLAGALATTLDLGPIEIKDPTNPDGRPTKIADLVSKILIHVADQIAQNPQIPDAIKAPLAQAQAAIGDVTNLLKDNSQPLDQKAKTLTNDLTNLLNQKKK